PVHVWLLPYVEHGNIFQQWDIHVNGAGTATANLPLAKGPLPVYTCPAMPIPVQPVYACWASYAFCRGNVYFHKPAQVGDVSPACTSPEVPVVNAGSFTYSWSKADGCFVTAWDSGLTTTLQTQLKGDANNPHGTAPNNAKPDTDPTGWPLTYKSYKLNF